MKRELKRAKTPAMPEPIRPLTFARMVHEKGQECDQGSTVQDGGIGLQSNAFAGQEVIQDHLSAPRDTLFPNTQGTEPGEKSQATSHTTTTLLSSLVLNSWDCSGSFIPSAELGFAVDWQRLPPTPSAGSGGGRNLDYMASVADHPREGPY